MTDPRLVEELRASGQRLVRTVDSIDGESTAAGGWAQDSLLPGWSCAHVVAHLALNADALAGCLRGAAEGREVAMYATDATRDEEVARLATGSSTVLRSRLLAGTSDVLDAVAALPDARAAAPVSRTPGSATFAAGTLGLRRLVEVEIHHADLALGYSHHDWPSSFAPRLLGTLAAVRRPRPFLLDPDDLDGTWRCGEDPDRADRDEPRLPVVSGPAADLGWWLSGRGDGAGLTSDDGELPRIEAW